MKKARKQKPAGVTGTTISHCTLTSEAPAPPNEHMASAVRALAEACTANAKALEEAAKRLAGPPDNRIGINVNG